MRLRRPSISPPVWNRGGFLLVELMVAVLLCAMVVVPLATCLQRAAGRAQALTVAYGELQDPENEAPTGDTAGFWGWGPVRRRVVWRPGPELDVWVSGAFSSEAKIGIWADGWLLGEWQVEAGEGPTTVDVVWSSLAGCELCIRAREALGGWGPPWRCVVPDAFGNVVANPAGLDEDGSESTGPSDRAVVLHTASFSTPSIDTSWAKPVVFENAAGLVFLLPECGRGHCEVTVGSEKQSWYMESDRRVDVYF